MCDSISIIAWIDDDLTDKEYKQCQYPAMDLSETAPIHADFRAQYPLSPLTGAGFKITPLGMFALGSVDSRFLHGRIAGYRVDINAPACAIGHNRLLVNGVPAAACLAFWMLKWWLAMNGCTRAGLDRINIAGVTIEDATLTYLFEFESESAAREFLAEYRGHTEAVMNKGPKDGVAKPPAYSIPKERPEDPEASYTFTSYVRHREHKFIAYVKEWNQANATLLPLADDGLEAEMEAKAMRTFRLEVQVHGKWLIDKELNKVSQWRKHEDPYKLIFGLVRELLRLDDGLRLKRLKKTTVPTLKLSARDKKYVLYHLTDRVVREHSDLRPREKISRSKYYSALRTRVYRKIGLDFDIPYAVQIKQLSSRVTELLVYRGEFERAPNLAGYMFSRESMPVVLNRMKAIVNEVLGSGPDSVPPVQTRTVYNGPERPARRKSGIGNALVVAEQDDE